MKVTCIVPVILLTLLTAAPLQAAEKLLQTKPVVIEKESDPSVLSVVKTFLTPRAENGKVKIWVFFTDKNIFDDSQFTLAAENVHLTERALRRRAKTGRTDITFADLPVYRKYIDEVASRGGSLRRVFRWLNAASYEIALDRIDEISQLSFVAKIRPVAEYQRDDDTIPAPPPSVPYYAPSNKANVLDYGISQGQLSQINVPPVHNLGYNGQGAVVAMFDTGYRKDHQAFAAAFAEGRVLAEWDFIFDDGNTQNEPEDVTDQQRHGTLTWSTLGGEYDGRLYGPAFGASFLLAKTEDIRSETIVEEDNWAAAVQWADSIGCDVISSSLTYSDWYNYNDYDGQTAITSIAANLATSYGIVVCNAMANSGPNPGTLYPPADAFEILSCGAVTSSGTIASFSSRGPTYDGRIKPEVCAQGVSTYCAGPNATDYYTYASGTSLSTPLVGGCAAVMVGARPTMTPQEIRQALMSTASNHNNPNNNYGSGLVNLEAALNWGANFSSSVHMGQVPLAVDFFDSSYVATSDHAWYLGEGDTVYTANPSHVYLQPGGYNVSMSVLSGAFPLTDARSNYVIALADTMTYRTDSIYAGEKAVLEIYAANSRELNQLVIPLDYSDGLQFLTFDSVSTLGLRTAGIPVSLLGTASGRRVYSIGTGSSPIPAGNGPIFKVHFSTDPYAIGGQDFAIDSATIGAAYLLWTTNQYSYVPVFYSGGVHVRDVIRGDANTDTFLNVGDAVFIINYVFKGGAAPVTIEAGDCNLDFAVNVGDATYLINHIFKDGPPPVDL